jgi:hypothetical protein
MARKLEKAEWSCFLDRFDKGLTDVQAEIEVASLNLGDQIQAEWVPLIGVVYDPKDDIIEVAVENLDHIIRQPQELYVEDGDGELTSLAIIDGEGAQHIVNFRQAVNLPRG